MNETVELALGTETLAVLSGARKSALEYYRPLLASGDPVLAVAAGMELIDRDQLPFREYRRIAELSLYGAIRNRALDFFGDKADRDLLGMVASLAAEPETIAESAAMRAELAGNGSAACAAYRRLYLATGKVDALVRELDQTYKALGPTAAIPVAARNLVMRPHEATRALRLFQLCLDAMRPDLIEAVAGQFAALGLHLRVAAIYLSWSLFVRGDPKSALARLREAFTLPAPAAIAGDLTKSAQRLTAEIFDKLGRRRESYTAYLELNAAGGKGQTASSFAQRMRSVAATPVPALPREDRSRWFTMTGFPRSGTTLLENALAVHPAIETFEELPTRAAMQLYLDRMLPRARSMQDRISAFVEARRRYYLEMERRRAKPDATTFIDKSPIRSADAGFIAKAFPDHRYVFSIRHPFDVVLSCFRQAIAPDMAMDGFRTIESAVALYDFTMTQWFANFRRDDPRVHYLRYDDLVTAFEPSLRGVLGFLGLEWDPAVADFAAAAEKRASRTPSYQKVRQGLSIGVQTSWRNYDFVFREPVAKPLHRWAEFFGYPTT